MHKEKVQLIRSLLEQLSHTIDLECDYNVECNIYHPECTPCMRKKWLDHIYFYLDIIES